jgi:tripartite-type tricarboxylate transporter receptor subunit TctC
MRIFASSLLAAFLFTTSTQAQSAQAQSTQAQSTQAQSTQAQSTQAQSWPQRAVRFIVPLGAGSATDISARIVAERLQQRWGQPVVIENRPGGDSFVAITGFLAANDDHTLLYAGMGTFTAHPYLHEKLPYDRNDIVPVAGVSNIVVAVAVPQSLKVSSLAELVSLARAQPGKLNAAAVPGITDFITSAFLKTASLDMARVPYRDINLSLSDLGEGRIQVAMLSLSMVQPQVQAGKVKLLAVTSRKRIPSLPEVPTVSEAGYPVLELEGLVGLYGLKTMPVELRERIAGDIRAVIDPAMAVRLAMTGQVLNVTTPAEYAAAIEDQRAKVAAVAQIIGIKASP